MQKITPFLYFDEQAEEAVTLYISLFTNSRVLSMTRYGEGSRKKAGTVFTINFVLDGQEFMALNGGPEFTFTPAVSFMVNCENQAEVDRLWKKLTEGGEEVQCGWLKDRYGLSWQIVPVEMFEYLNGKAVQGSQRAMQAMLKMKKIELEKIRQAYQNE
jgi:predicted 3-demethylubiquinone-9 3-methyltransferase (glyoxalase superfamily)